MLSFNTNMMASNAARNLGQHYAGLSTAVRCLSSGLRVNTAADDAAGLAIRELMRADIAAMNQGVRNVNDAISLIQTADGALGIIDEKLIRMKELAEQAATGTYNSDQRLMIDSEFQAMAAEIQRIATATDFNGVKLLDGSLTGKHDGSGLQSTGELKVHFGTANDAAEDYYYLNIGDATLKGLGLTETTGTVLAPGEAGGTVLAPGEAGPTDALWKSLPNGVEIWGRSGLIFLGIIPQGTKNLSLHLEHLGEHDAMQLFTKDGYHIVGTQIGSDGWAEAGVLRNPADASMFLTTDNGFNADASYSANGAGIAKPFNPNPPYNSVSYGGMSIGYSGHEHNVSNSVHEYLTIDEATEDLILFLPGGGAYHITATWDEGTMGEPLDSEGGGLAEKVISIETQELAQKALGRLDEAMIRKDSIRANLGAMQNRLENTVSNLQIQAENLQAAESRISDVDVAQEMTEFVRNQILSQSAVAMLSQANSMPNMLMSLIQK